MIKGEKIRFDVHNILYSIFKFNKTLNQKSIIELINKNKIEDISFLNNVVLNSMRLQFHTSKIINLYIKKKLRDQEKILLISSITQIVFLDFKDYAVINCSVEIAKKLNIYHGLINAVLKNISKDKKKLKNIKIKYDDLPVWFKNKTSFLKIKEKKIFLENFFQEPSLHIVFKNKEKLNIFEGNLIKTSYLSGFLKGKNNIKEMKSFKNGDWWVQDFSSFLPLHNTKINKNKKYLDACSAPGGKAFQILSKEIPIELIDKNEIRIKTLKSNLHRLNFKSRILKEDFTKFNNSKKYDFIILDAPCSAVGTIRKNPEIFFKNKGPNFSYLTKLQERLLKNAALLLNTNGIILYMVCSFLVSETEEQVHKFLKREKNFKLKNFELIQENSSYIKLVRNNFMKTLPNKILDYNIDGYFAAYLKKTK